MRIVAQNFEISTTKIKTYNLISIIKENLYRIIEKLLHKGEIRKIA